MAANSNMSQCALLDEAGLQDLILLPNSTSYTTRQSAFWSANAALYPACIVQPRTTDDVSRIIKVLSKSDGLAAVRSGGHTVWTGSNDVNDGVQIDLGLMTDVSYNAETNLASLQPGLRWGDVYEKLLARYSVCVTGGRDGNVGIGGFLTGGGNSYYAGLYGLACDSVANFEVVLASGDVVNANATSHADLWKALKGGSGNFGIVTRFDMVAFPAHDLWGGVRVSARSEGEKLAQTVVDFTDGNDEYPEAAYILLYIYGPGAPDVTITQAIVDTRGVENATAFKKTWEIPAVMEDMQKRSMADMANSVLLPGGKQQVWFSLTFKNDVEIINKAALMHDELVEELKNLLLAGSFSTQSLFQPLPTLFAKHSVERGGNMLGLDKVEENALLWLTMGATDTAEQGAIMREKLTAYSATLKEFGEARNSSIDWQYLNYADVTQHPLESYGKDNVEFMRDVAAKYDPSGVFQEKVVSGRKLSKLSV